MKQNKTSWMYSCLNCVTMIFSHGKPPSSSSNHTLQSVSPTLGCPFHHWGQAPFVLSTCCGCFAETHCCCTTCLGPGLAPASPHLCWQGISCALRQISKQPCSLLRSTSGKRYCFMFSVTLAMVGRERKHGNCHNRAHSNFDSRRRGTKWDLNQFWCQIK